MKVERIIELEKIGAVAPIRERGLKAIYGTVHLCIHRSLPFGSVD